MTIVLLQRGGWPPSVPASSLSFPSQFKHRGVASVRVCVCVQCVCVRVYIEECAQRVDPSGSLRVAPGRTVAAPLFFFFF